MVAHKNKQSNATGSTLSLGPNHVIDFCSTNPHHISAIIEDFYYFIDSQKSYDWKMKCYQNHCVVNFDLR